MSVFESAGVDRIHHYAPLHYLPFIARSRALLGKPSLAALGFGPKHLRSMSSKQDIARGFGDVAFLTLEVKPRILAAKLAAGFPHIGISVPAYAVAATDFALCRFNVAMTRQLRRGDKSGFPPSATNGRYYGTQQVPVARSDSDKTAMLNAHLNRTMIEVLIEGDLALPDDTNIIAFSSDDVQVAKSVLSKLEVPWAVEINAAPSTYERSHTYSSQVDGFIQKALSEPEWRGNGLEFDRV